MGHSLIKKVKQLLQIALKIKDPAERERALMECEPLTAHESYLWRIWARWRSLGRTLWPWQWSGDGIVYEAHLRAIEQFENLADEIEGQKHEDSSLKNAIENRRHQLLRERRGY